MLGLSTDNNNGSAQDAMQEFASNGYVSDEFNCFQYNNQSTVTPQSSPLPRQYPAGNSTASATAAASFVSPSLATAHWLNFNNYREQLNNMWRSMSYVPNLATTTGAAMGTQKNVNVGLPMPPDQVRNISNVNVASTNKLHKRYHGKNKDLVSRRLSLLVGVAPDHFVFPLRYRCPGTVFSVKTTMKRRL